MTGRDKSTEGTDLREQKRAIVRGLTIINSLNLAVVVLVAALALVAVLQGRRAQETAEKLWAASVTQARASRFGGEIGWKSNALQTIAAASQLRPSLALRNEAIAGLASLDLDAAGPWSPSAPNDYSLAFSPDLKTAAAGSLDGAIRLVELASGAEVKRFQMPSAVETLEYDAEGGRLAARSGGELRAWDLASGRELFRTNVAHDNSTPSIIRWAGPHIAASSAGGFIEYFDPESGVRIGLVQTEGNPQTLVCAESGELLIYSIDRDVFVMDRAGKLRQKHSFPAAVSSLDYSMSAGLIAAGGTDHKVYLRELESGAMQVLEGHKGTVFQVSFSGNGRMLASCAFGGTTRLWEVRSGIPLLATESLFINRVGTDATEVGCSRTKSGFGVHRLLNAGLVESVMLPQEAENSVFAIEMADDQRALVVRSSGVQLANLRDGKTEQATRARRTRGAVVLPDKQGMITSSLEGLQFWPFGLGQPMPSAASETIPLKQGLACEMIQLSADRKSLLARIGFSGAVLVDLAERKTKAVFNVANIGGGAISPDGKWVAIGTFHGHGTKIFAADGKLILDMGGRDASIKFSPDGRWMAATSSEACEIYEAGTWSRKHRIGMESASGLPGAAAFSGDSRLLAFTKQRRIVKLVDPETGAELAHLLSPNVREIESLAFAPGNDRLVGGTSDGMLQVWDLARLRQELRRLGLDWPAGPVAKPPSHPKMDTLGDWVAIVSGATLLFAIAYSVVAWRRHRQFVAGYARIESMMERQHKELAATQAELFQSQKMRALGTLAAGIAHDFNNLLSIIRMSNKLTAEEAIGQREIEENAGMIERAVAQGKEVVRSMLGYSRAAGMAEDYDPVKVMQELLNLVGLQFLHGIDLETEFDPNLPRVRGVRNRLEQMLLNLLVNAAEAMNGKGRLHVSVKAGLPPRESFALRPRPAESFVEISIADSGPGISALTKLRIFEPFFTTKSVGANRGTGLGLSMVYAIAQEEGIGIAVESVDGCGATFRLFLPARAARASERRVTTDPDPATVAA